MTYPTNRELDIAVFKTPKSSWRFRDDFLTEQVIEDRMADTWGKGEITHYKIPNVEFQKRLVSIYDSIQEHLNYFIFPQIIIKDDTSILNYFLRHKEIVHFIYEACGEILKNLNDDTRIYFRLDSDFEDAYVSILVRQNDYQEDFLEKLLDIGYKYIDKIKNIDGNFRVITDFQNIE